MLRAAKHLGEHTDLLVDADASLPSA